MNSSPQLLLSLQDYIVELQTQNRSLKQHIFTLQTKLEQAAPKFHDQIEKLKIYIDHCQHQILKRENREIGLIDLIKDLEVSKQEISRQRDVYIQQIDDLRRDVLTKQEQITKLQKEEEQLRNLQAFQTKNIQNLPPKSGKCKNCEAYIRNQQILQQKLNDYVGTIKRLEEDIDCLQQFI